jgi:membrane carboxypeptidase/penicillin-binding protein PbpC
MLSIGVTPKYTVAIWFGNFDRKFGVGRFDRRRSGLKVAVPAMLNIFENLEDSGWFKKPKRVVKKRVCLEPIVVKNCRKWLLDWTIEGVFLHTPCTILTPQLLHRFIRRGEIESLNDLKTHRCFEVWRDFKPVIEGVSTGKTYIKNRLLPKELKKIGLKCYSFEANQTIFWVINNQKPLKALSGESTYIYLPPDSYEIRCIDMGSKEDRVEIKIEEF